MSGVSVDYQEAFEAYRAGRLEVVQERLEARLRQAPDDASALLLKGAALPSEACVLSLALLERSVALDPGDAEGWYNLGAVQSASGKREEALESFDRAVALVPDYLNALANGGELLRRMERFDEGLAWAERHQGLDPGSWVAALNRAICLSLLRRFEEADEAFAQALAAEPDRAIIHWEMFAPLLHQRRLGEAWDAFERRFACGHLNGVFHYPFPQPLWRGEPLKGKSILIHNEQGLGDQLMFACALPEIMAEAKATTLVCAPELLPLFRASFPKAKVLPCRYGRGPGDHPEPDWLSTLGRIDYQAPIGSLMALRRRSLEAFGDTAPYLRPSEEARVLWEARAAAWMPASKGRRIGVCWASNPALFRDDSARRAVKKSMTLETLAPIASTPGVQFVSVLNWPVDPMPKDFAGRLLDVSADLRSLDDTAALIEQLDLVIAVDTSVAHLAGALGRPVWLMLHDPADCRWGLSGEDSYWYPSMRLFRQETPGDWAAVVRQVGRLLKALQVHR